MRKFKPWTGWESKCNTTEKIAQSEIFLSQKYPDYPACPQNQNSPTSTTSSLAFRFKNRWYLLR